MVDTKPEITEEEKVKELQARVEEFNKELIPLLRKYELGLGASAFIKPDGTIGSRPIMFDDRKKVEAKIAPEAGAAAPSELSAA